ncbi:Malectin-like carbohydrate-binding domain-containing protein [Cynara cardunculus var. scolymus]|uniref:Malectin-like carbohydrate-binding domain-containing protein n=1 Tax=Cynara cardunculus var. scolymus TaxID=59895 RepID=A0A103XPP8_CYNCS|nr:Malectin-like carbohydrate-binding domain-containing protein [Cynara cardunculus var. scolymus]
MAIHLWFLIHLLLILLSTISVSSNVFVSINCGASGSYTDENSIAWTGDADLISNGVPHTVQSNYSISPLYDTLRAFTTRRKNCYSIEAEEGGKVLVRVVFNYGNYDGKSTPPMFDLHLDGNFWVTVNTSQAIYYEAIYVVKRKVISICVAQTNPNQFPFISSLEVRSVDPRAYNHIGPNYALFRNIRNGYGLNETIRFPTDPYDRVWNDVNIGNGLRRVVNDASFINANTSSNPPQAVLKSAITPVNDTDFISLGLDTIAYPFHYPMYINFYFIEVKQLNATETRSFRIYIDAVPFSLPIVPHFGNATEYFISNLSVTADTSFHIVGTGGSMLSPLLSAIEIFSISNALNNGTNNSDVEGLISLQKAFDVLQEWGGDPCLPAPYSWDWIKCNNDSVPRVTSLNLNSFNLSGRLPDFRNMDALEIINLADNQFSGSIPRSLSRNSQLILSDTGNPLLCTNVTSCTRSSSNKKKTIKFSTILTIIIPVFFIF